MRLTHGIFSARTLAPKAAEIEAELIARRPDLEAFPAVSALYGYTAERLRRWAGRIEEHETEHPGEPVPEWWERRLQAERRLLLEIVAAIGDAPRAAASLARDRVEAAKGTWDLHALADAGRRALAEGQRRALIESSGGDDDEAE